MVTAAAVSDPDLDAVMGFVAGLVLPSGATLGESFAAAPWLPELLSSLLARTPDGLPAVKVVALTGPRGIGKTTATAAWLLTDSLRRRLDARCVASDGEQAELNVAALRSFLQMTPRLPATAQVMANSVRFRNGSRVQVLTSDLASSYGLGAGVQTVRLAADEVPAWPEHAQGVFESLLGSAVKLPDGQLFLTGSPGISGSWQHELWQRLGADPEVHVVTVKDRPPWVSERDVDLARRLLPPASFARFFEGQWVEQEGEFIPISEWDACKADLPPLDAATPVVLALDLGVRDDFSGGVVVSRWRDGAEPEPEPEMIRAAMFTFIGPPSQQEGGPCVAIREAKVWKPGPHGEPVDLEAVFRWTLGVNERCNLIQVTLDPHQGEYLAERLRERGVWVHSFSQLDLRARADALFLSLIRQKRVAHDGNEDLREHVGNASLKISAAEERGVRIVKSSPSRKVDLAVAASMGVYQCLRLNL